MKSLQLEIPDTLQLHSRTLQPMCLFTVCALVDAWQCTAMHGMQDLQLPKPEQAGRDWPSSTSIERRDGKTCASWAHLLMLTSVRAGTGKGSI